MKKELLMKFLDDLKTIGVSCTVNDLIEEYQNELVLEGICPCCYEELESVEVDYNTFMKTCESCGFKKGEI